MVNRIKLSASVGRQRVTKLTPGNEAAYVQSINSAMKGITENYAKLVNGLENATPDVLYDALVPTFAISQKYVPKDTGALERSGFLEKVAGGRVVIGYAKGGHPHYAAFVHELTHLKHKSPTRAKFLLTALEQDASNIQRRIIRGYKTLTGQV